MHEYRPVRRAVMLALVVLTACTAPQRTAPPETGTQKPPRLVVLLIIDQWPSWSFARDVELVSGGIKRLVDGGVVFSRAELPHALTFTATGHAVLGTGAPPSVTHILANSWYDPVASVRVEPADDPDYPVFRLNPGGNGGLDKRGVSPVRLAVDGVADALRAATSQKAKAVSIAAKERSAVFALGRRPNVAVWYEPDQLAMTTSRFYGDSAPEWLATLNRVRPAEALMELEWAPLAGVDHGAVTGIPDNSPGEQGDYAMGEEFPYRAARSDNPPKALRATPFIDELLLDTVMAAMDGEGLGKDDIPDLLAVSFSAHDYAGHYWGQESWERLDVLLRLDQALDVFFRALDARLGKDAWAVVLTSDHGATRLVEQSLARGVPARRITRDEVTRVAEDAAARVLGPGRWVAASEASAVYITRELAGHPERDKALDAMTAALAAMEGMGHAARVDEVAGDCDKRAGWRARMCWSLVPGMSGDIALAPAENSLLTDFPQGTSHGSLNPDDSTVPIVVYAPGWAPRRVAEPVSFLQVAPTLAALLGIAPPPAAHAPALAP